MKSMVEVGPPRLASAALPEDAATLKKFVNQRFKNVGVGIFGFLLFLCCFNYISLQYKLKMDVENSKFHNSVPIG